VQSVLCSVGFFGAAVLPHALRSARGDEHTTTPENPRLADQMQCTGGCIMRILVTFILANLMSIDFFGAFAAINGTEEVDPCGTSTGDVAIAACTRSLNINPRNVFALVRRGIAYKDKGDLDHAISDYSEAIRLDPENAFAFNNRGNAYLAKRDFDHAIADYDQSLRINPDDSRVLIDRALPFDAKGDHIQSDQDYRRVLVARLTISKRYPREALQRGVEGVVRVAFSIDREGKVTSTRVVLSSGSAQLDEEALTLIERAQPFPSLPDQSKDQVWFTIPIRFRIE
jgi:TonB family protein